jgi:hypothetical protein
MTQSKDNGHGDYQPEVKFEYRAADVWVKEDADGNRDIAYTKDVEDALDELEEEDEESDSEDE